MRGSICRMPAGFMLHWIGKQVNATDIPVYDVFFSSENTFFKNPDLQKYLRTINREMPDDIANNKACLAWIATRSFAVSMTEPEMRKLVRAFQKDGILNHFVFHKRFTNPHLPIPERIFFEKSPTPAVPRSFSAALRDYTTLKQWDKIKKSFVIINRSLENNELPVEKNATLLLTDTLTDNLSLQEMNALIKELYQLESEQMREPLLKRTTKAVIQCFSSTTSTLSPSRPRATALA